METTSVVKPVNSCNVFEWLEWFKYKYPLYMFSFFMFLETVNFISDCLQLNTVINRTGGSTCDCDYGRSCICEDGFGNIISEQQYNIETSLFAGTIAVFIMEAVLNFYKIIDSIIVLCRSDEKRTVEQKVHSMVEFPFIGCVLMYFLSKEECLPSLTAHQLVSALSPVSAFSCISCRKKNVTCTTRSINNAKSTRMS